MRFPAAALVAAFFLVAPGVLGYAYSPRDYPGVRQVAVEGHTGFAVIEAQLCWVGSEAARCPFPPPSPPNQPSWPRQGPRSEGEALLHAPREEGVVWFNDQRLTDPVPTVDHWVERGSIRAEATASLSHGTAVAVLVRDRVFDASLIPYAWRDVCGGWVFATNSRNPDPRTLPSMIWTYVESYRVVDPNDYPWTIDRYSLAPPTGAPAGPGPVDVWVVPVLGFDGYDPGPDSGISCFTLDDRAPHDEWGYGDLMDDTTRRYNALLWLPFESLVPEDDLRVHGDGAPDDADGTGCQPATEWQCPLGLDNEGNSHPWNPTKMGPGPIHAHEETSVSLYFAAQRPLPPEWRYYAVYDDEGSAAPFAGWESGTPVRVLAGPPGDPAVLVPTQGAAETHYGVIAEGSNGWPDACEDPGEEGMTSACVVLGVSSQERTATVEVFGLVQPDAVRLCSYSFLGHVIHCTLDSISLAPNAAAAVSILPYGGTGMAWKLSVE